MDTIIWDWNGTLLDDIDLCISTINVLLKKRGLPLLGRESYREVFSFPVKEYYQTIGFDFTKEDFVIPAKEYIDLYNSKVGGCRLHSAATGVLCRFKNNGLRQFVLSAMEEDMLVKTLKHSKIFHFFEAVAGLNDHYAVSKVERGIQFIRQYQIEKENTVLIGDTIHDFEVAERLGVKCILIAGGHQSEERLKQTGAIVLGRLTELETLI